MRLVGLFQIMFEWAYRRRLPEETNVILFDKPTLQIHGTRDWLLPIRLTNPDIRIEGGAHLIPLTCSEKVNEIIESFIWKIEKNTPAAHCLSDYTATPE
jgi:pimeloyl-ACP methyl ester carboxylesterase